MINKIVLKIGSESSEFPLNNIGLNKIGFVLPLNLKPEFDEIKNIIKNII